MKRFFLLLTSALLLLPMSLSAQDEEVDRDEGDDVEASFNVGAEKKLTKKLNLSLDGELRTRDNFNTIDRVSLSPAIEYKFLKQLKFSVGGAYAFVNNDSKEKYRTDNTLKWIRRSCWASRYRGYVALTGNVNLGRFNVSLRERYQLTYRTGYTAKRDYYSRDGEYKYTTNDVRDSKTNQVLRSRLLVDYAIRHSAFKPFASVEMTNDLVSDFSVAKMRYAIGTDWKLNKHHSLEFCYMYQDVHEDDGEDDCNSHILSLGYKYKF